MIGRLGDRTERVGFVVTFRLVGEEKSVLEVLFHRESVRGPWVGETLHRVWVLVLSGVCV